MASAGPGTPVADATVHLRGAGTARSTTTDKNGKFAFEDVAAGSYTLRADAKNFEPYETAPFALADGQKFDLVLFVQAVTTSSISKLGTVVVKGHAGVSTAPAPTVIVTNQQFVQNSQFQIQNGLAYLPGVTVEHYDNGAPGNVATFTIRGAGGFVGGSNTGYEILVQQDGEPMRNGQYGDFDVSALTPAIYQRVEVVKGVGGSSLFGANSIGGTVNLVTRDPLRTEGGEAILGFGGFGTSDWNLTETNTIGRFGYIIDLHQYYSWGFIPQPYLVDTSGSTTSVGQVNQPTLQFNLYSGMGKVRYDLSNSTYLVATFNDESDTRNQFGLLANPASNPVQFDPAGYPLFFGFPGNYVWNIQPRYSADLHSEIGGGSLEVRWYSMWLERVVDGQNGSTPPSACCFIQRSLDHLTGQIASWERPFGNHTVTLAIGGNGDSFLYGSLSGSTPATFNQIPYTSGIQIERTYLARDDWQISNKWSTTIAAFLSNYTPLNTNRFDPRISIINQPDANTVFRASYASAFAPPTLADIYTPLNTAASQSGFSPFGCPAGDPDSPFCVASSGNPAIQPETATGWDLGAEHTWGSNGDVSVDIYHTQLHNHIYDDILPAPPGTPPFSDGTPIAYIQQPINLAGTVYSGIEAAATVPVSNGFYVHGYYNTQSAYPTNLSLSTEIAVGNVLNSQQFLGVPLHKLGWQVGYQRNPKTNITFGADWEAQNNSYNVPPFWVYNATLNAPIGSSWLHVGWWNMFNKNALIFSCFDCGVPYNGAAGPYQTTAYSTAPHMITITFDHRWGSLK
ncbi:MAG: TonB-dependent receptor [Candidatus Eremiobacteraeota bacterium]|nr:TonB-dependent receptor [Candidatus Eremiobacteraeota bacterium]MBV8364928.1 TonB-dependent receptor [Candidatus Eremiobacteraeota bacterium]